MPVLDASAVTRQRPISRVLRRAAKAPSPCPPRAVPAQPDRRDEMCDSRLCRTEFLDADALVDAVRPATRRRGWGRLPAEFRESAVAAGPVVGKEYVRPMVAFLTNDVATVRPRHRLRSPRRTGVAGGQRRHPI